MSYRIAGVDVHKRMLAVALADVEVDGDWQFERRQFGTSPSQLQLLAAWLVERDVEEVAGINGAVLAAGLGGVGT